MIAAEPPDPWPSLVRPIAEALGVEPDAISAPNQLTEGWSAQLAAPPQLRRFAIAGLADATSIVVKRARPDHDAATATRRSSPPSPPSPPSPALRREAAALDLLTDLGSAVGPRVLARGHDFLVLDDLGRGPAVEDVLVGHDPTAATHALVALATSLGAMQAASLGHHADFYARLDPAVDPRADRLRLAGAPLAEHWATIAAHWATIAARGELTALDDITTSSTTAGSTTAGSTTAGRVDLPDPREAHADVDAVIAWLAEPGPWLALSTGDLAPQNTRLDPRGGVHLLDFEHAAYRHAMLDAAHLRLPFYGAPCWGRIPAHVGAAMESAFRTALAPACPAVLDDPTYAIGMAAATAAWAITRLVRLAKLLAHDEPHPMGFSRRGQLLDTLQAAIHAARTADTHPALRGWLERTTTALRYRWPGLPATQPTYPAFRTGRR